jgi:4-amino-4-deoxy-L-arabinose transferase-like glycosyltransferase
MMFLCQTVICVKRDSDNRKCYSAWVLTRVLPVDSNREDNALGMSLSDMFPSGTLFPVLIGLVVISRVLFAIAMWKTNSSAGFLSPDTQRYLTDAGSLLHGSFSDGAHPDIFRTPGYPLFLTPAVFLQLPVLIALFGNLLLAVLSACLIWQTVSDLCPRTAAASWAVFLYCFEPVGFLYSEKVLSETLFTAQFLMFVWLAVRFLKRPALTKLALAALALGCATYTRPVTIFLGLWLFPALALVPRILTFAQRIRGAVLFQCVFALILAPWAARNAVVAGYYGFSSNSDYTLYFYSAAAVNARLQHKGLADMQAAMGYDIHRYFSIHPEQRQWSEAQVSRYMAGETRRIIFQHPLLYFRIHARGCVILLLDPGATELLKEVGLYPESGGLLYRTMDQGIVGATVWFARQSPLAFVLLVLLGIQMLLYYGFGVAGLRRLPAEMSAIFLAVGLYLVLVSGFPSATARFRAPIMSLVCIAAGMGIAKKKDTHIAFGLGADTCS